MLDIVANHASPTNGDYSTIVPFNKPEHYHSCKGCTEHCSIPDTAYASAESWPPQLPEADLVKQCRLVNLADLNQTHPFVRQGLIGWLQDTLQKFPFDAIRMDTVKHVETVGVIQMLCRIWRMQGSSAADLVGKNGVYPVATAGTAGRRAPGPLVSPRRQVGLRHLVST